MKKFLIILIIISLFTTCVTSAVLTDEMTPAQIIQRAQEAMDKNRFKVSIEYYEALRTRYMTHIDLVIEAEYHIAFINYKQKKYDTAIEGFNGVLAYYTTPDAVLLPQHFKRLSEIVLNTIDEKTK